MVIHFATSLISATIYWFNYLKKFSWFLPLSFVPFYLGIVCPPFPHPSYSLPQVPMAELKFLKPVSSLPGKEMDPPPLAPMTLGAPTRQKGARWGLKYLNWRLERTRSWQPLNLTSFSSFILLLSLKIYWKYLMYIMQ
jgi:hypothetical protein